MPESLAPSPPWRPPAPGAGSATLRLLIGAAVLLGPASVAALAADLVFDLDDLPSDLPYAFVSDPHFESLLCEDLEPPFFTGDLDQDGWAELVCAVPEGFVGWDWEGGVPRIIWQQNYPVEFLEDGRGRMPMFFGCVDIDGDSRPEIVLTACTADRTQWRLWAYDADRDANDLDLLLPLGPDRKADGVWDGWPRVVGFLASEETGDAPGLLLTVPVGYDMEPRSLLALSVPEGRVLWRSLMGTNPDWRGCSIVDADGDGERDILVVGGTSNNMPPGMLVEETRDDQCVLFRYDAGGRRRWWRELGRGIYGARLEVADLDGDGALEIVTGEYNHNPGGFGGVRIWSPEGEVRAQKLLDGLMLEMAAVPAAAGAPGSIYAGSTSGQLSRLVWQDGRLSVAGRALAARGVCLVAVGELIEEIAGTEVVAKTAAGRYVVMDGELRPLAAFTEPDGRLREIPGLIWHAGPGRRYLLLGDRRILIRRLEPSPAAPAFGSAGALAQDAWRVVLGLIAAVGASGLLGWRARRSRARKRAAGRVGADRERLAALLRSLEQSSHGAVAVTRGVRRLAWLLEALASGLDRTGSVQERARQTWTDFRESTRAELLDVLTQAQGTPCGRRAGEIGAALERFVTAMERAFAGAEDGRDAAAALPAARQAALEVEEGFSELRREVESYFTVDLRRLLERVLLLREDELVGAGIRVSLGPSAPPALECRADPADLRFAVDNLVGNAAEAMLGSETRELALELAAADGQAVLEVADTGRGIEPERCRTLFEPRASGPRGLGLCRSRELLRRWTGDVELVESEPGRGSRFRLRVPLAVRPERKEPA